MIGREGDTGGERGGGKERGAGRRGQGDGRRWRRAVVCAYELKQKTDFDKPALVRGEQVTN